MAIVTSSVLSLRANPKAIEVVRPDIPLRGVLKY
jgi:hypothetical protein